MEGSIVDFDSTNPDVANPEAAKLSAVDPDTAMQAGGMILSVIVPVRDGDAALGACLESLLRQNEPGWVLGEHWELLVVDDGAANGAADGATDSSLEAVQARAGVHAGVQVLPARSPLPKGWTARNNALWTGAEQARGRWLLLTDAATIHLPGANSRAVVEADRYKAGMLSYSARQVLRGLLSRAVLPLVLSEVATAYPPVQVNDPAKRLAFADRDFLLLRADVYSELGGVGAAASSPVAEVDLAFGAKRAKVGLRYRHAPDAVERHYVSTRGFRGGWEAQTATFALLVNNALALALWRLLDVALVWGLPLVALLYPAPQPWVPWVILLVWLRTLLRIYRRSARSNFPTGDVLLSLLLGLPVFAVLAYVSWFHVRVLRRVRLQGREYPVARR